jgi:glycosyltransferase involved in cell wall biosynthesis
MRVDVVDPSAYTPPYDHSLCAALAGLGAHVRLITTRFPYGSVPAAENYSRQELFYRLAVGDPGSRARRVTKLVEHAPDMIRYRMKAAAAQVVHFQWLPVPWLDRFLLPGRPTVLTAHDLLPREPRPGQVAAQRRLYDAVDAVVVHSRFGRAQLIEQLGLGEDRVTVIPHGAFDYLTRIEPSNLPPELEAHAAGSEPVVLFFGLIRPYKGVDVLLDAWRQVSASIEKGPQLWIVGRPRVPLSPLRVQAPPGVRFVPRFVSDPELVACFRRADLVVLPYRDTDRYDFSGVLATALAFGTPAVISDVGGFADVASTGAARLVQPGRADALAAELSNLLGDAQERQRLSQAARAAAAGRYSWGEVARQTLALYEAISQSRSERAGQV